METCKVEIINFGGYVPGVKTTMERQAAEGLEKAGNVKILETENNKLAPEVSKKTEGKNEKHK